MSRKYFTNFVGNSDMQYETIRLFVYSMMKDFGLIEIHQFYYYDANVERYYVECLVFDSDDTIYDKLKKNFFAFDFTRCMQKNDFSDDIDIFVNEFSDHIRQLFDLTAFDSIKHIDLWKKNRTIKDFIDSSAS